MRNYKSAVLHIHKDQKHWTIVSSVTTLTTSILPQYCTIQNFKNQKRFNSFKDQTTTARYFSEIETYGLRFSNKNRMKNTLQQNARPSN